MAFEFIHEEVEKRRQQHLLRAPVILEEEHEGMIKVSGNAYINFSSNDYLGLRQNPLVLQAWVEGLAIHGGGSGASPLVTGFTVAHQKLCDDLAVLLNRQSVLLFSSGFAANQAICQALFKQPGRLFADKLSHASLIEGGYTSQAEFKRFAHNDLTHLARLMDVSSKANDLIATEGVFSMDGDCAPVSQLAKLAKQRNAWLMIDDAHGFGILGEQGEGAAASQTEQSECQIIMGTLGKACGTGGAFIAGSKVFIEYMTNFAKHFIYSTSMPPAQAHASSAAIVQIKNGDQRTRLYDNIDYFKNAMRSEGFDLIDSNSAIQPIIIGDPQRALAYSQWLKSLGLWISPIRYPTVTKNTDRLRITLNSLHQKADINALIDALNIVRDRL